MNLPQWNSSSAALPPLLSQFFPHGKRNKSKVTLFPLFCSFPGSLSLFSPRLFLLPVLLLSIPRGRRAVGFFLDSRGNSLGTFPVPLTALAGKYLRNILLSGCSIFPENRRAVTESPQFQVAHNPKHHQDCVPNTVFPKKTQQDPTPSILFQGILSFLCCENPRILFLSICLSQPGACTQSQQSSLRCSTHLLANRGGNSCVGLLWREGFRI